MRYISNRLRNINLFGENTLPMKTRHDLYLIIWSFAAVSVTMVINDSSAYTGYLRTIGAGDFVYSFIKALPMLASALQIWLSVLLERTRAQKKMLLIGGIVQRSLWLPFGLIPFFIPAELGSLRIFTILLLSSVMAASGAMLNISFMSLVGDIVPLRIRGRYFAVRSMISLVIGLITGISVSAFLDKVNSLAGYAVIFAIAGIFGLTDILLFLWIKFPEMPKKKNPPKLMPMVADVLRDNKYMRVVLYATVWGFSVNISSPFFSVYQLEYLHLSYSQITLYGQFIESAAALLFLRVWGKAMDEFGNKPVTRLLCGIVMLTPIPWMFTTPDRIWPFPIISVFAGMVWSGLGLSLQNMYLEHSSQENRSMYIAVFMLFSNLFGVGLAFLTGGFLMESILPKLETALNWTFMGNRLNRFHYLFGLSALLRTMTLIFLMPAVPNTGSGTVRAIFLSAINRIRATGMYKNINARKISNHDIDAK